MENPPIPAAVIEPEQDLRPSDSDILAASPLPLPGKEPPATTSTSTHQERASSQLRPEDLVPKQHVERYDTFDSLRSSFGPRTNTGFSVAMSTTTDYTEPDLLGTTLNDDDEGEGTPALRGAAFPSCPSDGLPSFPPTRMSSFAPDELSTPTNPISAAPGPPPGQDHDTGPSYPGPSRPLDESHVAEPSASDRLHIKVEMTSEESELTQSDHTLSQKGQESDADSSSIHNPGGDVVENVCDQVLKDAFHLGLEELATTDAAAEAYEATRYYLDELSRIVPANNAADWAPSQSQMTRDPGGYGQAQSSSPSQGDGGGHGSRRNGGGNKRRSSDDADDHNQDGYDDGYGSGGNGKRPRTDGQSSQAEDLNLSCPFRKRNPVKFNVRDFLSCATQSFPDVSQLKRHVKLFHKQKSGSGHACPRCKTNLGSKSALDRHLAVTRAQICEVQSCASSQDPEDGISAKIEDVLNGRRANSKVDTWDILWRTLFPKDEDSDIPHPDFIPPIELEEVQSDFHLPSNLDALRALITANPNPDDLLPLITRHIDTVFSSCRDQKTGSSHPKRRRRQQKPKTAAAPPTPSDAQGQGQNLSLRPVPFPYDDAACGGGGGDSSPGSAISGGSWFATQQQQQQQQHLSPMTSFLTTESSNASIILSPQLGNHNADDLSPAAFGGAPDSLSPSPSGFDGPVFPTSAVSPIGGGYQFRDNHHHHHHHRGGPPVTTAGGVGVGIFGAMGFGGGGERMVPYQIATTSMAMHPHPSQQQVLGPEEDMVPTTAIDRSGGFGFGGHMGHGGGGGGY
ncbi:hypothetical protein QBC39DRAFT_374281 [Podospora conica]|nr:hypothetical protein QBC39DRAFT_374281 [Schizothecium conicum]